MLRAPCGPPSPSSMLGGRQERIRISRSITPIGKEQIPRLGPCGFRKAILSRGRMSSLSSFAQAAESPLGKCHSAQQGRGELLVGMASLSSLGDQRITSLRGRRPRSPSIRLWSPRGGNCGETLVGEGLFALLSSPLQPFGETVAPAKFSRFIPKTAVSRRAQRPALGGDCHFGDGTRASSSEMRVNVSGCPVGEEGAL